MNPSASLYPGSEKQGDESSLELKGLIHALLRHLWIVILSALVLGAGVGWYLHHLPAQFESKATLEIETAPQETVVDQQKAMGESDSRDPMVLETAMQNFRNRSLFEAVSEPLHLAEDAVFLQHKGGLPVPETEVINRLNAGLTVVARPKTLLLDVTFRHPDPEKAQLLAGRIVDQFLLQDTEAGLRQAEGQNRLLQEKAAQLQEKVSKAEAAVLAAENQSGISVNQGTRNLVEEKLQSLNTQLSGARSERLKVESDLHLLQTAKDRSTDRLLEISSVATDPEVIAAQTKVKAQEEEIQALEDRYRAKHPRMIEAHNRLDVEKAAVGEAVKASPNRLSAKYDAAKATEQTLEKAVAAQEKELLAQDAKTVPYHALQQEVKSNLALYEAVSKKLKESYVAMDIKKVNYRITEPAMTAYEIKSHRLLLTIAGAIAGALLASGIIAAFYFLDASIKTVDDAERLLRLPVLAAVPLLPKVKSPAELLALLSRPDSPVAESYRSLRTALSLLGPATDRKIFLFTSAIPNEGKTLTAANTAIAFAQQGLKTVVLEADLRKPMLSRMFVDTTVKRSGISEFLIGETPEPVATEIPNLFLMPAGGMAPNPAELLSGPRFAELITQLKGKFDRVIIDTAPVNVVSDTLSIVITAQTIVLVVRHGFTSRKAVRRALELLERAHVKPDGLVLNMMPQWSGIGHHYYYSSNSKYGSEGTYGTNYPGNKPELAAPAAR